MVESLEHSAAAYDAAQNRLKCKDGGMRRQVAFYLEDLYQLTPVHPGQVKDIENLTDLLDEVVIYLLESGHSEEFGNESLY